jgi:hypothetical protein
MIYLVSSLLLIATLAGDENVIPSVGMIEPQLRREQPAVLAGDARRLGDARRGALIFYQPALACTKCHFSESAGAPASLGPDLTALGKNVSDVDPVESPPRLERRRRDRLL